MLDWFRSWHGAPTDDKWLVIAKRAGVPAIVVPAIAWALFDHASQAEDRGEVGGFDFETYAMKFSVEEDHVRAVYAAMEAKGIIVDGRISQWEKRQPKREEGSSSERVRAHRKKSDTQSFDEIPKVIEQNAPPEPAAVSTTSLISPEAMALADEIAVIAGHELRFVPPSWCGAANRTQMWLSSGWNSDFILQCVKAQMARKRDGPPASIQFFEKGIATQVSRSASPLPAVSISEPEIIYAKARNSSGGGFAGLSLDLARQARDEAEGERSAPILRVVDG